MLVYFQMYNIKFQKNTRVKVFIISSLYNVYARKAYRILRSSAQSVRKNNFRNTDTFFYPGIEYPKSMHTSTQQGCQSILKSV